MSERFITTGEGVSLLSRVDGPVDAPVLLCSNSLGTAMGLWEPQVESWTAHRRVLRYDQRGHGDSDAPEGAYTIEALGRDALAVLDAYEVNQADLCGLSMGGLVALWIAINHPERVRRLVLACTAARVGTEEAWLDRVRAVREGGTEAIADMVMERFFSSGFRERDPQTVERYRQALIDTPDLGYIGSCLALARTDLRAQVGQVTAPTLVVIGEQDEATTPAQMHEQFEALPNATAIQLDGAGHLANLEAPDAFAAAVLEHLTADDPT